MKPKMYPSLIASIFSLAFISIPFSVNAYTVTNTAVTQLTDSSYLYTLEYEFGFLNADAWLPVATYELASAPSDTNSAVEYELSNSANVAAVVFSDAEFQPSVESTPRISVKGSPLDRALDQPAYYIPRGTRESFTFTALVTTEAATPPTLTVAKLPFILLREGELSLRLVNNESLEPFFVETAE